MERGWIKLYRKIQDNEFWQDRPYDLAHAWIDILLRANHKDNEIKIGWKTVQVPRGSFITSLKKLSENWGWSKSKVYKYLKYLKKQHPSTIRCEMGTKWTQITICNYEIYQGNGNATETLPKRKKNAAVHKQECIKNDKNDIKDADNKNRPPLEKNSYSNQQTQKPINKGSIFYQANQLPENELARRVWDAFLSKYQVKLNWGLILRILRGEDGYQEFEVSKLIDLIDSMPDNLENPVSRFLDMVKKPATYK